MPCNSDYMNATPYEIKMSRLLLVLDELDGGKTIDPTSNEWQGYDPRIYGGGHGAGQHRAWGYEDKIAQEILDKANGIDLTSFSLEVQIMVRDLKKLQKKDAIERIREQRKKDIRARAIGKLTPEEREVLGIEDNF